jgi:hypothetical protein
LREREGGHAFDRATRGTYSIADVKVRFFVFLEPQDAKEIAGGKMGWGVVPMPFFVCLVLLLRCRGGVWLFGRVRSGFRSLE